MLPFHLCDRHPVAEWKFSHLPCSPLPQNLLQKVGGIPWTTFFVGGGLWGKERKNDLTV